MTQLTHIPVSVFSMLCQHDVVGLPSRGVLNGVCIGAITAHEEPAPKTRRNKKTGADPRVAISDDVRPTML
jgi:hypothetical protein